MIQRSPRPRYWPLLALLAVAAPAGAEEVGGTTGSLVPEQVTTTRTLSIMSVTDNIHVGMGYDNAMMTICEGRAGLVTIDSIRGGQATTQAMAPFRETGDTPVAG